MKVIPVLVAGFCALFCGELRAQVGDAPDRPRTVLAHYMVCFAVHGDGVEAYKREIQEAQAAGIDGFALNEGAWSNEPHYVRRTASLFQAAQELGTGFKFILSLDLATLQPRYIPEIIKAYAGHPNYLRVGGRPMVSTFSGELQVDWKTTLGRLKSEGCDVCFVPFFYPRPKVTELPDHETLKAHAARWSGLVDGMFYFGAAGTDLQLAACNRNYARVLRESGKLFMAGVSPCYWGAAQTGRRYFEMRGGLGIETQWKAILECDPEFVEIVTWNDLNESYICPRAVTARGQAPRCSHAGYLELTKYYIAWYKTGRQPPVRDALYYFYRIHPKDAVPRQEEPVPALHGEVKDDLYLTLHLTEPSDLQVATGPATSRHRVPAGLSQVQLPFSPGPQRFEVFRDGRRILSAEGEPIQAGPDRRTFFPTSGFAYADPDGKRP